MPPAPGLGTLPAEAELKVAAIFVFLAALGACSVLNDQTILGTWQENSGVGGSSPEQWVFESGGELIVHGVAGGSWSLDGDVLTLTEPGGDPVQYTATLDGSTLTLTRLDGSGELVLLRPYDV